MDIITFSLHAFHYIPSDSTHLELVVRSSDYSPPETQHKVHYRRHLELLMLDASPDAVARDLAIQGIRRWHQQIARAHPF